MEPTKTLALTEADVARQIGVSVGGLRKWRRQGTGPKFIRLGRLVRYSVDELEAWLLSNSAPRRPVRWQASKQGKKSMRKKPKIAARQGH